ncbi:MAG: hypothetical protein KAX19_09780, partial [Candidatus Brocadiae bacterium]|nr:hypothetical protein [Candidatus Brocadiia bacterium]
KTFKKCGAKIKVVAAKKVPRGSTPLNHFKMVGLQVEAEGNVDSIVKMLHALEKGPRFIRVEQLKIHHDAKKPMAMSVTVEIVAYDPVDGT